jgi:septum site-determining protein MinD
MATVVSIVSGKGGSGKSLLTAMLGRALAREGQRVLLVDTDIFVRGLTILLFGFKRPERKDGAVTVSDLLGVFSENSQARNPLPSDRSHYMIQRFYECDVLPAVDNIGAPLDYDDRSLSDEQFSSACIENLISSVQDDYDYILLDNRAGMDSLIAASCRNAQIVIAVAEDDDVGRQTNINLVRFLQSRKNIRIVYTILNKGRHIRSYADIKQRAQQRPEFTMLGVIPFDMEILENFGSDRFWTTITQTLYFRALLDVWNELAKTEPVRELSPAKYDFPPRIFMRASEGRYTLIERMLRLYSILFMFAGVFFWVYQRVGIGGFSKQDLLGVIFAFVGITTFVLSTSGVLSYLGERSKERPARRRD